MSLLLSAGLMLEHVGRRDAAQRLRGAIDHTINQDNIRTRDIGGRASTREFAEAVARCL
jgi:isocitrate dehydrogenase (NAD+)